MARWNRRTAERVRRAKETDQYWSEKIKLDFALKIHRFMERAGLTKTQLAEKIGVSQPYVTKALRGDANLTIDTMVKLARAVGAELSIELKCPGKVSDWCEEPDYARPKHGYWRDHVARPANDLKVEVNAENQDDLLAA